MQNNQAVSIAIHQCHGIYTLNPHSNPRLQPSRSTSTRAAALTTKSQLANLVGLIQRALLLSHLGGGDGVAGRHVHAGVVGEEVARPQEQRHRLDGHDGEVLGGGDVCHAECVPEDDVGVFGRFVVVGHPLGETH